MKTYLTVFVILVSLLGCGGSDGTSAAKDAISDHISTVKDCRFQSDLSLEQAFDHYKYFSKVTWGSDKSEIGEDLVYAVAEIKPEVVIKYHHQSLSEYNVRAEYHQKKLVTLKTALQESQPNSPAIENIKERIKDTELALHSEVMNIKRVKSRIADYESGRTISGITTCFMMDKGYKFRLLKMCTFCLTPNEKNINDVLCNASYDDILQNVTDIYNKKELRVLRQIY